MNDFLPKGHAAAFGTQIEPTIRLRLIGQMEAWASSGESVLPSGRKAKALLAVIALSAPRPVLRLRLISLLWSMRGEQQARASLRQEIHHLLRSLPPATTGILRVTPEHLSLILDAVWVDAREVLRATAQESEALSLVNGDLLEDLNGIDPALDIWLKTERERLRNHIAKVAEVLLRKPDAPEEMLGAAQRILKIDRTHEGAWRALIRAHADLGNRDLALQDYERCRQALADLMDVSPSAETRELLTQIRGSPGQLLADRPQMMSPVTAGTAVPKDDAADSQKRFPDACQPLDGVRVGILPVACVGLSERDAYIGPFLADEISAALSRVRWIVVLPPSSLSRCMGDNLDWFAMRRDFGVDVVLNGTLQRDGPKLRIALRLCDLRDDHKIVWAQRFYRQTDDITLIVDEVAAEATAQIGPALILIEAKRATARPLDQASPYDLVLRSIPLIARLERESFQRAGEFLARAIALDENYAAAHTWYSLWHVLLITLVWAEDQRDALRRSFELANRAIVLDPLDAKAFSIAGFAKTYLTHDLRAAAALHDHALTLNPNHALAWAFSALTMAYLGEIDEAERRYGRHMELSARNPHSYIYDAILALICLLKRDYQAAMAAGRRVILFSPSLIAGYQTYLAALGYLGFTQEAEEVLNRLLAIEPDFTIECFLATTPLEATADREHYAEGLRRAGVAR